MSFSLQDSLPPFSSQLTPFCLMIYRRAILSNGDRAEFFLTEGMPLLIFLGSYWPRHNICYCFQGLWLWDENLLPGVSPTVEMRKYLPSFYLPFQFVCQGSCLLVIETIHSSHTSQLTMALKLLEREMGGEKLPKKIFFNHLEKRPLRSFFTDSVDVSLSKLQEIVKDREVWHAAVHEITKTWFNNN